MGDAAAKPAASPMQNKKRVTLLARSPRTCPDAGFWYESRPPSGLCVTCGPPSRSACPFRN